MMPKCKECGKDLTFYTGKNDTPYFGFTVTTYRVPDGPNVLSYRTPGRAAGEAYDGLLYCSVECMSQWANRMTAYHKERREYYRQGREARMRLISAIKSRAI